MALVGDDESEKVRSQRTIGLLNDVEERGVRCDINAAVSCDLLLSLFRPERSIGQVLSECIACLFQKCHAIHKKQDTLYAVGSHEHIKQGNARSRFACTRRHDKKEFPLCLLNAFQHRSNGFDLVRPSRNVAVDQFL